MEMRTLIPLLQHLLNNQTQMETSSTDDGQLRKLGRAIAAKNFFLLKELRRVIEAFQSAGIEVIVLKGAALIEGLYPHLGLRPFGDIDILIHKEELPRAIAILSRLDYRLSVSPLPSKLEDFNYEVVYVKMEGKLPILIELHWRLGHVGTYEGRVDVKGLWQRAKKTKVAGVEALVLCPVDQLLHSCLHLFHHRHDVWLVSASDIAEMLHRYCFDWEAFLSRAFEYRVCFPIFYSLTKTVEVFQPPLPGFVLDRLGLYRPSRWERFLSDLVPSPDDKNSIREWALIHFLSMPGIILKLRFLLHVVFLNRDSMLRHYNIARPALLPLYYLLHLKEGLTTAVRVASRFSGLTKIRGQVKNARNKT